MIKKLQRKFVLIVMLSLLAVLLLVVGGINGMNIYQINQKSDTLLTMLTENGGNFPRREGKRMPSDTGEPAENQLAPPEEVQNADGQPGEFHKGGLLGYRISEETPFETRYFTVTLSEDGDSTEDAETDMSHIAAVSSDEAKEFMTKVLDGGKKRGYCGQYKYQMNQKEDKSILCVFVDCGNDLQSIRNFALLSLLVGAACILMVLVLVAVLSGRAIRPVIESMEKQKQFITDAGHEIKTPIAIISANAEVIEMCGGENEWTRSIRNQVRRLDELVKNLLALSRLDEMQDKMETTKFLCGKIVKGTVDSFTAVAQSRSLLIEEEIDQSLYLWGNEEQFKRLVTLLMDNAVKYADEGGRIKVSLGKKEKGMELCVYNDCDNMPEGDLNRLFDRFYRADSSRSRQSGGYGIGLSAALAIVKAHKGKITARAKDEGICFTARFPGNEWR